MSQNIQGFEESQRHQEQQSNTELLNSSRQNTSGQSQQQAAPSLATSGISPSMLLPNQAFGSLLQPGNSAQPGFDINSELKRLQQLQQLGAPAPSNNTFLLPNGNASSNAQLNQAAIPNQAAFLQTILDQQKLQNNNFMGSVGAVNPLLAHPGLLQDARLLLAQSQLGSLIPSQTNSTPEVPLPSPHSLFHRDGSRRMRGGVIVRTLQSRSFSKNQVGKAFALTKPVFVDHRNLSLRNYIVFSLKSKQLEDLM